eukprot:Rhum_TRINITY_DN6946_c0_g2::Rhum_TRINITY_DN6946_c0_g2_i1::g.21325::m.21325
MPCVLPPEGWEDDIDEDDVGLGSMLDLAAQHELADGLLSEGDATQDGDRVPPSDAPRNVPVRISGKFCTEDEADVDEAACEQDDSTFGYPNKVRFRLDRQSMEHKRRLQDAENREGDPLRERPDPSQVDPSNDGGTPQEIATVKLCRFSEPPQEERPVSEGDDVIDGLLRADEGPDERKTEKGRDEEKGDTPGFRSAFAHRCVDPWSDSLLPLDGHDAAADALPPVLGWSKRGKLPTLTSEPSPARSFVRAASQNTARSASTEGEGNMLSDMMDALETQETKAAASRASSRSVARGNSAVSESAASRDAMKTPVKAAPVTATVPLMGSKRGRRRTIPMQASPITPITPVTPLPQPTPASASASAMPVVSAASSKQESHTRPTEPTVVTRTAAVQPQATTRQSRSETRSEVLKEKGYTPEELAQQQKQARQRQVAEFGLTLNTLMGKWVSECATQPQVILDVTQSLEKSIENLSRRQL